MKRFALPLLAGLLAGTALAGPAFAAKDLVVGIPDNITTLDPADINDTLSQSASRTMMQGLFGFDKDMKLVPLLAESFTVNDAATEYTYHLRKGVPRKPHHDQMAEGGIMDHPDCPVVWPVA